MEKIWARCVKRSRKFSVKNWPKALNGNNYFLHTGSPSLQLTTLFISEKEADKAARDAILRKIEQDKAERRARNSGGAPVVPATSVPVPVVSAPPSTCNSSGKTKLAIRLLDGSSIIQEFDAKEVLSAVRAYIVTQKNIACNITLAMPPAPPFSEEDFTKPLHALGLVPNARLTVVKRNNL